MHRPIDRDDATEVIDPQLDFALTSISRLSGPEKEMVLYSLLGKLLGGYTGDAIPLKMPNGEPWVYLMPDRLPEFATDEATSLTSSGFRTALP